MYTKIRICDQKLMTLIIYKADPCHQEANASALSFDQAHFNW